MPNIDEDARRWQMVISGNAGAALRYWRHDVRKLSAAKLSQRCTELGFPISRVAVSKIENNSRQGKLEVAEILVLARALQIAPIQLLYPNIPDGRLEFIPNKIARESTALKWFTGWGWMHHSTLSRMRRKLMGIAQDAISPQEEEELRDDDAYGEATSRVRILEELAEYEREAATVSQQLRHPSLSGQSAETEEKRASLGQWLTKNMAVIAESLELMRELGMVVRDEDHHFE